MGKKNYYGEIGSLDGDIMPPVERKYTVIQSLWTKPIKDKLKLRDTMFMCALSLECAHRNGYKVHMHTDSKGFELLKHFGYEKLKKTLDNIPDNVPADMFAAGKFYAMRAEGTSGKVHIDVDVFIKKAGLLDRFYEDSKMSAICQMEEDMNFVDHSDKIYHMHVLGYPSTTRPNWRGSMNTGIIGFRNRALAKKYFDNYFDALKMYTNDRIEKYKNDNKCGNLHFDFILEQIELSYLSVGYNVYTLLPTKKPCEVAENIGYAHLQGDSKWSIHYKQDIKAMLHNLNASLYAEAAKASSLAMIRP